MTCLNVPQGLGETKTDSDLIICQTAWQEAGEPSNHIVYIPMKTNETAEVLLLFMVFSERSWRRLLGK